MRSPSDLAPVFIMGSHRSGTTWLHQLIAGLGDFDYLSAFHVIDSDRLLQDASREHEEAARRELAATFERLQLNGTARAIDNVVVSPELPEEYGFVLDNAGTGFAVTPRNLTLFERLVRRVQRSPAHPIVLKSGSDYANFRYLHEAFPRARFVFIHRHPERVVQSLLSTVRRVHERHIPYLELLSPSYGRYFSKRFLERVRTTLHRWTTTRRFGIGLRVVTDSLARANRYFVDNIHALPRESYVSIRYEDLCRDPSAVFARVLRFLELDPERAQVLSTAAAPRELPASPEVVHHRALIARKTAAYMQLHDYAPGGAAKSRESTGAIALQGR